MLRWRAWKPAPRPQARPRPAMALEMSLPHAPRIQQVAADGTEAVAHDEQQWQLYCTVQQALQAQQVGAQGIE